MQPVPVPLAGCRAAPAAAARTRSCYSPITMAALPLAQVSSAKAVSGRCPVQPNCLSCALITAQEGIWGGTTGEERWPAARRPAGPGGP